MRYTPIIGSQDDEVEYQSLKPKHHPCPQCGKKGKRKHVVTRRIAHVGALTVAPGLSPMLASTRPDVSVASISRQRFQAYHPAGGIPWK